MIKKGFIKGIFLFAVLASSGAYAATQSIVASPASFSDVSVGDTVQFTVNYPASNPADATGLGLKIYYDSSKLTLNGTSNVYATNKLAESVQDDTENDDSDTSTDKVIIIAWVAFSGSWPGAGNDLVTVNFTAAAGFTSDTQINFTGSPAAGNTFSASPIPVKLKVVTPPPSPSDNTPPVVTAPADITKEATGPTTAVSLGTGTATDNVDGAITPTASPTGPFAVGVHTVTWSATDAAGNTGTATQKVTVTDTTPPVVTPPANKTVTATGTNTPVTLGTATATDLVDGTVTATPSTTGPFPVGTTTISWTATDSHGNTATATQTVTITEAPVQTDTIPPVITLPPDVTVQLQAGQTQATVDFGTATAVDNVDGVVPVSWTQGSDVRAFTVGAHTIIWRAVDAAGNVATATQKITVLAAAVPPPAPAGIPTLSEWGIILLSLLLALVSWRGVDRKKQHF